MISNHKTKRVRKEFLGSRFMHAHYLPHLCANPELYASVRHSKAELFRVVVFRISTAGGNSSRAPKITRKIGDGFRCVSFFSVMYNCLASATETHLTPSGTE